MEAWMWGVVAALVLLSVVMIRDHRREHMEWMKRHGKEQPDVLDVLRNRLVRSRNRLRDPRDM